jgi:hypothetical protein
MSVSAVPAAAAPPVSVPSSSLAMAADGDYKAQNARSVKVKDADGDYKPIATAASAAAQSSAAVQSTLPSLKKGG